LPRFAVLDAARGLALAAMVVFHFSFDLDSLGLAALDVGGDPRWRWFARLIAGSFLALSGMSLVIAHAKGMRWDSPRGPMSIDAQTRDVVQTIYIRRVEKVGGELVNVPFDKIDNVKDPASPSGG